MFTGVTSNPILQTAPPPNTDAPVVKNGLSQLIVPLETPSTNLDPARLSDARDTPFTIIDTVRCIASQLDLGSLRSLQLASGICNQGTKYDLIARLNRGDIVLADLNIGSIYEAIDYFGEETCKNFIFNLDLCDFPEINDADLEKIEANFLNLTSLSLKLNSITDKGCNSIAKMKNLKSLTLTSPLITNVNFVSSLENLEHLDLSFCTNIKDFSPVKNCSKLKKLELVGCKPQKDISFFDKLTHLKWVNVSLCYLNPPIIKYQNLQSPHLFIKKDPASFDPSPDCIYLIENEEEQIVKTLSKYYGNKGHCNLEHIKSLVSRISDKEIKPQEILKFLKIFLDPSLKSYPSSLLAKIKNERHELTPRNLTALVEVYLSAKIVDDAGYYDTLQEKLYKELRNLICESLSEIISANRYKFSWQALIKIIPAFSYLKLPYDHLLPILSEKILIKARYLTPQNMLAILGVFEKITPDIKVCNTLADIIIEQAKNLDSNSLTWIFQAFERINEPNKKLFDVLAEQVPLKVASFQDIVKIFHAFATLNLKNEPLFDFLTKKAISILNQRSKWTLGVTESHSETFKNYQLLISALVKFEIKDQTLINLLANETRNQIHDFAFSELIALISGFFKLGFQDLTFFSYLKSKIIYPSNCRTKPIEIVDLIKALNAHRLLDRSLFFDIIKLVNTKIKNNEWPTYEMDIIKSAFDIPLEYYPPLADMMADYALKLDIVKHLKRNFPTAIDLDKGIIEISAFRIVIKTKEGQYEPGPSWKTHHISPMWNFLSDEDKNGCIQNLFKQTFDAFVRG